MRKALVIEDWWADRLRFQYILERSKWEVDFAWIAGRPGRVWSHDRIIEESDRYDSLIIDLAWRKEEEDAFAKIKAKSVKNLGELPEAELRAIGGVGLIAKLAKEKPEFLAKCIIVSAYTDDPIRERIKALWHLKRSFKKWDDEDELVGIISRW